MSVSTTRSPTHSMSSTGSARGRQCFGPFFRSPSVDCRGVGGNGVCPKAAQIWAPKTRKRAPNSRTSSRVRRVLPGQSAPPVFHRVFLFPVDHGSMEIPIWSPCESVRATPQRVASGFSAAKHEDVEAVDTSISFHKQTW